MAETTMDAIKKKMQAMRLEKESAFDRADQLEHRLVEQKYIYDKVAQDVITIIVTIFIFILADRTNGRAMLLCPSVVCNVCTVAKRCVLRKKCLKKQV